jgi:hypothetical protein
VGNNRPNLDKSDGTATQVRQCPALKEKTNRLILSRKCSSRNKFIESPSLTFTSTTGSLGFIDNPSANTSTISHQFNFWNDQTIPSTSISISISISISTSLTATHTSTSSIKPFKNQTLSQSPISESKPKNYQPNNLLSLL